MSARDGKVKTKRRLASPGRATAELILGPAYRAVQWKEQKIGRHIVCRPVQQT